MPVQKQERRPTPKDIPPQKLDYPASQADMTPKPDSDLSNYKPAGKLEGKVSRSQRARSPKLCILCYFFLDSLPSFNIKFTYIILLRLLRLIRRKIHGFSYLINSVDSLT